MNSLGGIFITSFLLAFSGAVAPGPVLTMTIGEATRRGFWTGPLIILGHGILELLLFVAVISGAGRFLTLPAVKETTSILGGGILVWLGIGMIRQSNQVQGTLMAASPGGTSNLVLGGFLISISNPYWTIWWATIGLSYIALSLPFGRWGLASFYCGHILADLCWYTFVSGIIALGKKTISPKVYHFIILLCGLFLLIFGLYFSYSGFHSFLS
ncbi:MAG: LysE family transporter [bacterium]